jgi:ABC-type polysaccharide/polyol phosphate transport system ATPase subunit
MSSEDIIISVKNLTKAYRLFGHSGDRIKQFLSLGFRRYHREFTALKDVSFDIKKGETVGIIGRNGSGKSTLLQLICGILKPTAGTVKVNGRVSAMLELGAGFNPEFTGRENVYFQGTLMGLAKAQMDERFDTIATFADIGEFIDQPVRTYSSGMFVRLAFATMVHVDADILIIDEAIAVGDEGFRARCFRRLGELGSAGCTILFVSHAMDQINRFCNRALLLDHGRLVMQGQPAPVVEECLKLQTTMRDDGHSNAGDNDAALPYEPNGALIEDVQLTEIDGLSVRKVNAGKEYHCRFRARLTRPASAVRGAFLIRTPTGFELGGTMTEGLEAPSGSEIFEAEMTFECRLNPATYVLDVALFAREGDVEFALHGIRNAIRFEVEREQAQPMLGSVDLLCRSSIRTTTERRR